MISQHRRKRLTIPTTRVSRNFIFEECPAANYARENELQFRVDDLRWRHDTKQRILGLVVLSFRYLLLRLQPK